MTRSQFPGVRAFLGVPLKAPSGVPVGVICLFDFRRSPVDPEDLEIVQVFGNRGTWVLGLMSDGHFDPDLPSKYGNGVVMRSVFEALLDCELRLLTRGHGSLALAVVDRASVTAVQRALADAPMKERLLASSLSGGRVAFFQRVSDGSAATRLFAVLVALRSHSDLSAIGTVDLEDAGLRPFSGRTLLNLGELALESAQTNQCGVWRVVIREETEPLPGTP
jgi:hypothetical protein